MLVEAGADTDAETETGFTPLHMAAGQGNLEVARILVDAGADLGAKCCNRQTAEDLAEARGMEVVLTFLREVRVERAVAFAMALHPRVGVRSLYAPSSPVPVPDLNGAVCEHAGEPDSSTSNQAGSRARVLQSDLVRLIVAANFLPR